MMTLVEFEISKIIREERSQRGWDQANLARRLGGEHVVGQQTVSRWERGGSRPRRSMIARLAEVFETDTDRLLRAAGYATATADRPEQAMLPVKPLLPTLPLGELSPELFEQFTADLIQRLRPNDTVNRFGGPGHKQDGVDGIVQRNGQTVSTFQCKRHKQFGAKAVEAAVGAVAIDAPEHVLVLSRVASPEARRALDAHPSWSLWDADDIARTIRTRLSQEDALGIVQTYFPAFREAFLGIREPGPWVTGRELFSRFGGDRLFTHDWPMIGRHAELDALTRFAHSTSHRVGVLVGRGGIGKTRLLRDVASELEAQHVEVRFLDTGREVSPTQFEQLPRVGALVVVIDDAHDRDDIAELVAGIGRVRSDAKVLLAMRPYGFSQLAYDLRRVGLHPSDLPRWDLNDLSIGEATLLASEVLGDGHDDVARHLAVVSADCPLITVIGAGLIKRGQLDASRLETSPTIRQDILATFRDTIVGDRSSGDSILRASVLDTVALLQPFRFTDDDFRRTVERVVDLPFDRISLILRSFEDAGVLLRRGQALRIVPDLLGDVVLAEACFEQRGGGSTGFIERVRTVATGAALQHLFVNASRVDWQTSEGTTTPHSFADSLWSELEAEYRQGGLRTQLAVLDLLKKVAFFQPDRALDIIRWALTHHTDEVEEVEDPFASVFKPTRDMVLHSLPEVLKLVAYNVDYLPESLDLLWRLAQDDTRPTNQNPDHPIRILSELAGYDNAKPAAFNSALIDAAERWLKELSADSVHSPFDVIEPMLATEGTTHSSEGLTITLRPFLVNAKVVEPLRDRVVAVALTEARSSDLKRAVRAVAAVEAGLRYPMGMGFTDEHLGSWTPSFVGTIDRVRELVATETLDPAVLVAVRRAVRWHAFYSSTPTRAAAEALLESMPDSIENDLAIAMFDGWGHQLFAENGDYEELERQKQARFVALAQAITESYTDEQAVELVTCRLAIQRSCFGHGQGTPGPLVWELVAHRPSLALAICDAVARDPRSVLGEVLPIVLAQLLRDDASAGMDCAERLLAIGSELVVGSVALAFGWNRGNRAETVPGEFPLLARFATHESPGVRQCAVRAAQVIATTNRAEATALLAQVRFADSAPVAEDLFATFAGYGSLEWAALTHSQAGAILEQLVHCPSIEGSHIALFLANLSQTLPSEVVALLQRRVEHSEETTTEGAFRPLPYHWQYPLQIRGQRVHASLLRQVRDWIGSAPDSWQRQHYGPELFAAVASDYDAVVIDVLSEALNTGTPDAVNTVAAILREGPRALVWDNVDFVTKALSLAFEAGEEPGQRLSGALHGAVTSGVRSGTPGQPFAEDVEQQQRSLEVARSLIRGSIAERFYRSLAQAAQANMQWHADTDEQFLDNREW
jgi:transcriptional regulator with XRE-family HTH domain